MVLTPLFLLPSFSASCKITEIRYNIGIKKGGYYGSESADNGYGWGCALALHSNRQFCRCRPQTAENSTCYVFSDNVQYRFKSDDGESRTVIPDASINCRVKSRRGNTFIDAPRFVMEVLSPSTEKFDRTEKMELYRQQEIEEYWIVDWEKKQVEIYQLDYENGTPRYYLWKAITEANKEELKILHFPNVKITFDELFDEVYLDS